MNAAEFSSFLEKNSSVITALAEKKIFLITGSKTAGLLQNTPFEEARMFLEEQESSEILETLLGSRYFSDYPYPLVVDIFKAVDLYKKSSSAGYAREEEALSLARFSFMGTDGMRGKIARTVQKDAIKDFVQDNLLTPEMIELASKAYGRMLLDAGLVEQGAPAIVGNDGRDQAVGGILNKAMTDGLSVCGFNVEDLGVVPTPFVPYRMVSQTVACGAMLTASHNPANQNGIKFFLDGKKNLPEGRTGDYSLAGWMYDSFTGAKSTAAAGKVTSFDITGEAVDYMTSLAASFGTVSPEQCMLVLDTANGAFNDMSIKVLDELKLSYVCVNETPNGENINKSCGVSEVEGTEEFEADRYDSYIKAVKEVFDQGRSSEKNVFGIILDGDGDRGLLLYYNRDADNVICLDGDKCAYLLARYLLHKGEEKAAFVTTVESDLMAAFYAEQDLGLTTKVVSVGDKWICTFNEAPLLVGTESSGHLILPLIVTDKDNKKVELRSGNGLLTCLMTLGAIHGLQLDPASIIEPYKPGFSRTFYTYFVDKSLFFKDSAVWKYDTEVITGEFSELKSNGDVPGDIELVIEEKEDAHMLYASFCREGAPVAAIFCRNSGTEDKTAVYVKCKKEDSDNFLQIAAKIAKYHQEVMKNTTRVEYTIETNILAVLQEKRELSIKQLVGEVKQRITTGEDITENSISPVLYALKKEGRIFYEDELVKI